MRRARGGRRSMCGLAWRRTSRGSSEKEWNASFDVRQFSNPRPAQLMRSATVGYSVIAFNLVIPQCLDPLLLAASFPFPLTEPPFPDLDPRTASEETLRSGKTVLQLSRLTMVMDAKVVGGGKGVFGFVSFLRRSSEAPDLTRGDAAVRKSNGLPLKVQSRRSSTARRNKLQPCMSWTLRTSTAWPRHHLA